MKRLYLKIVDSLRWMHSGIKHGIKKHAGYHIQSVPYSSIVHPKITDKTCCYYTHPSKLEEHCKEMGCNGHKLYFCWTKHDGPQKERKLDDERISRR